MINVSVIKVSMIKISELKVHMIKFALIKVYDSRNLSLSKVRSELQSRRFIALF